MKMKLIMGEGLTRTLVIQDELLERPVRIFEIKAGRESTCRLPNIVGCDWVLLNPKENE